MKKRIIVTAVTGFFVFTSQAFAQDAEAGKTQFRKCATCHSIEEGKARIGPSLFGVLKRTPGSLTGYRYSNAMQEYGADGALWTEARLMEFLASPRTTVPGTKMGFPGLKNEADRLNLIAYLKEVAGN